MSSSSSWRRILGLLACALGLSSPACSSDSAGVVTLAGDDAADDAFLGPSGKADAFGVAEKTPTALGILRLVNESDLAMLTAQVGVSPRSAKSIVEARVGDDGQLSTHDDHEIVTLVDLDAIAYVGPKTFERLHQHAKAHGFVQPWSLRYATDGAVIAIGDLHGDIDAARTALQIAGAIDDSDAWIGGDLTVVQLGDVLDRGDGERQILDLFDHIAPQAKAAGGRFVPLLGNHELMNVYGDLSYVTAGGFSAFADVLDLDLASPLVAGFSAKKKPRAAAFMQGGPYARRLAKQSTIAIVGDTLFVHGGILPKHVDYGLDAINYDARAWMLWDDLPTPPILDEDDSPVWYRGYGEESTTDCSLLKSALDAAGVKRMVVAHTPQLDGITSGCADQLYRINTGMSAYYGGPVQVLELRRDDVWIVSVAP